MTENEFIQSAKTDLATGHAGSLPSTVESDLGSILSHLIRYEGDLERARDAIFQADSFADAKSKLNALKISKT